MAKRNSTSKKHPSPNRAVLTGSQPTNDTKQLHRQALHEAIEAERTRLSQAQAMLECLRLALENTDDGDPKNQIYCPDIVEIVLEIVRGSVNRLDSVYIRPLVDVV